MKHFVLQSQIEDAIWGNKAEQLKQLSDECGISLDDLDKTVQPIIESCTKDAIQVRDSLSFPLVCLYSLYRVQSCLLSIC